MRKPERRVCEECGYRSCSRVNQATIGGKEPMETTHLFTTINLKYKEKGHKMPMSRMLLIGIKKQG